MDEGKTLKRSVNGVVWLKPGKEVLVSTRRHTLCVLARSVKVGPENELFTRKENFA